MKFSQAIFASLSLVSVGAVQQQSDIYYHEKAPLGPSMWHFSSDGLAIFAPNGDLLKAHPKPMLCKEHTNPFNGEISNDCNYFAFASDGHKYVWASSIAGDHSVQAFDIDTGDYAGYLDTCSTPIDMEYHPARDEMFVRCAQEDTAGGNPGEIDVFSSATLSSNLPMVKFNDTARPYGRLAIHSSMGPYGYSLAYDQPYITEMDLSSKTVSATYEVPDIYGGYDTTYSPINQHLYFRSRVCCTCNAGNMTDTDVESCGRGPGSPVMVKTGPSKSTELQTGVCSGGCEGSRADTIGVVEFDIVNKVIVDTHNIKEGTGWGADPVSSPDGKWIVLLGNDGGQNVRIMQAGSNGQSSASSIRDVAVDFTGGTPGRTAVSDVAFVQDGDREILVVGANSDNHVVLIDLSTFDTTKVNLAPSMTESTGGGARALEWAVGTNYVWINGGETREAYILEITGGIETASLYKTLSDVAAGDMLYVNNYERMQAGSSAGGETGSMSSSSAQAATGGDDDEDGNTLGLVGVVLGALGLLAGIAALAMVNGKSAEPGLAAPLQNDVEAADVKTLGSKRVS